VQREGAETLLKSELRTPCKNRHFPFNTNNSFSCIFPVLNECLCVFFYAVNVCCRFAFAGVV
jgi:hypothetical protein